MTQQTNWSNTRKLAMDQIQNLYFEFKSELQVLWKLGYSYDALLVTFIQLTDFQKSRFKALRKVFYHPKPGEEDSFYRFLRNEVEFCIRIYPEDPFSNIRMMIGPCIAGLHKVLGTMSKEDKWRDKCCKTLQRRIELQFNQNEEYHKTIGMEVRTHGK